MGTCSYVLTGTEKGFESTFGSTCHGAGRACSRNRSRNQLDYKEVLDALKTKGIAIRWVHGLFVGAYAVFCGMLGEVEVRCWVGWRWGGGAVLNGRTGEAGGPCRGFVQQVLTVLSSSLAPSPRRVASPKLVMEEAPESYKDVTAVVDTCHAAGISKKTVKLRPIGVVKG